jgi:hypothetical protein
MSTLEVNTINPQSGNDVTIGGSSKNVKFPSGTTVDFSTNTPTLTLGADMKAVPAFEVYLGSDQTGISDSTYTKVEFNTEEFDTNSTYDHSTNYRFTPAVAGKYFIYSNVCLQTTGGNELDLGISAIYKNGAIERHAILNPQNASMLSANVPVFGTIDLNTTDYIEIFAYIARTSSGSRDIKATSQRTHFGAYRIIGA